MFSRRQLHFELFDERCHVAVADHGALPFLDAHNTFGDFDGKVALYFRLAAQAPIFLDFFAGEMSLFRVENLSSTFNDLAFALSARTFTATCGGQIHTVLRKCGEQASALLHLEGILTVDRDFDLTGRGKIVFRDEQNYHQHDDDGKEDTNTCYYKSCIHRVVVENSD